MGVHLVHEVGSEEKRRKSNLKRENVLYQCFALTVNIQKVTKYNKIMSMLRQAEMKV